MIGVIVLGRIVIVKAGVFTIDFVTVAVHTGEFVGLLVDVRLINRVFDFVAVFDFVKVIVFDFVAVNTLVLVMLDVIVLILVGVLVGLTVSDGTIVYVNVLVDDGSGVNVIVDDGRCVGGRVAERVNVLVLDRVVV